MKLSEAMKHLEDEADRRGLRIVLEMGNNDSERDAPFMITSGHRGIHLSAILEGNWVFAKVEKKDE